MDFVEKTSKFEFSSRGYPIHFVQKSFQKLTTKGGGQSKCQKFARYNCMAFAEISSEEEESSSEETESSSKESSS